MCALCVSSHVCVYCGMYDIMCTFLNVCHQFGSVCYNTSIHDLYVFMLFLYVPSYVYIFVCVMLQVYVFAVYAIT